MEMKYIVIKVANVKTPEVGDKLIPIVFPGVLNHVDVYEGMCRVIERHNQRNGSPLVRPRIESAGFIVFGNGTARCYGKSESLGGVESKPEVDAQLILDYDGSELAVKSWEYY